MTGVVIVYFDPDGLHYVAMVGELGWLRWPAIAHGWAMRRTCSETRAEACTKVDTRLGRLALLLSGWEG